MAYVASLSQSFGAFCIHPATLVFAIIFLIAGMILALVLKDAVPWNYIALFSFTLGESVILASSTAALDPESVLTAIFVTLLMSAGLTAFAFTASEDSIVKYMILIFVLWLTEFLTLGLFFSNYQWAASFMYSMCALLYGVYLVVDAHMLKETSNVDEYIPAAIIIYLDIIRIFIYILAALGKKK